MALDRHAPIVRRFAREARTFARSPAHRDPERLRRLLEAAAPRPGESALDVACGPGIVTAALARAGAIAIGFDLTGAMLREIPPGPWRVRGAADALPFRDAAFDLVICRNSLHHFLEPERAVREMGRVLRPGGRLVVEDITSPEEPIERDDQEVIERLRDPAHVRSLPRSEMRDLAEAAGLRVDAETACLSTLDFQEWVDRPDAAPAARERARFLMEARVGGAAGGLRPFREGGRLRFERSYLILRAGRP